MIDIDMSGDWADELLESMQRSGDEMLERMQQPGARERMQKAFHATPEELGKAAVEQARKEAAKYCNGCCYGSHCLGADPDCGCCKAGDEGCYPK